MGKIICILVILIVPNLLFSQTNITGVVKDNSDIALASVTVMLKDSLSKSIISYTFSDNNGHFQLKTAENGKFNVVFNSLGYESKTVPLLITKEQKERKVDVVLKDKPMNLNEVIIKTELPMVVKKDTI